MLPLPVRDSTSGRKRCETLKMHWTILLVSVLVFVALLAAGLVLTNLQSSAIASEEKQKAVDLAGETGNYFRDSLERSLTPLFSLAQFATEIPEFRRLPVAVGPAGVLGSLPFLQPQQPVSYRNITNSACTNPATVDHYNRIAAAIKRNANQNLPSGVILGLFLAPQATVCMIHPLINTDDIPEGSPSINSTGSLGLDFATDPILQYHGHKALSSTGLVVAGPLPLRRCTLGEECVPIVKQMLIARFAVEMEGNTIEIDGTPYENKWGFVAMTINWKTLVDQSGMYSRFAKTGHEFRLSRTDQVLGEDEKIVILAESSGYPSASGYRSVTTTLKTQNNEWKMSVRYSLSENLAWNKWAIPIVVLVSLFISSLVCMVLAQKQQHTEMLGVARSQQAVATERDMTAYFAHELKNPLGAIDSALTAMPEDLAMNVSEAKELHQAMKLCTDFMSKIMNNLLDVRKLEEGKMELHSGACDLELLLAKLHRMLLPSVKSEVDFSYQINLEGRNWVMVDEHRLHQVMANVATNAIKYTRSGSVHLKIAWQNKNLKFECSDTGPGIPKQEQAALFQRFVQRGGAPGTGLGLAIAKRIVDLMQGTIYFESDPTVAPGTTCVVSLPLPPCVALHAEDKPDSSVAPIEESFRCLVVDDIRMNRTLFKRRFQKAIAPNCEITEACTGEEALEICERERFDVIIMDQYLGDAGGVMTGTDVIIAMRRMGISSLIIGCSGNDMEKEFGAAGADFTWGKPLPSNDDMNQQIRAGLATPATGKGTWTSLASW